MHDGFVASDIDVAGSLLMTAGMIILLATHAITGAKRFRRVTQQGGTFFLGIDIMHAGYWMLQPAVRWCVSHGVTPNAVTWGSLVPAIVAAGTAATGHWGLAAWALLIAALFDVLDGAIARATGEMSSAGAILDSVLDRYAEFLLFGGLLLFYRGFILAQLVVMAAAAGSFLITYSTAKAEALQLSPPRGSMKRSDRLTVLIVGMAVTPLVALTASAAGSRPLAAPVLVAVGAIAVLANVSAIRRFTALARAARHRTLAAPSDGNRTATAPIATERSSTVRRVAAPR